MYIFFCSILLYSHVVIPYSRQWVKTEFNQSKLPLEHEVHIRSISNYNDSMRKHNDIYRFVRHFKRKTMLAKLIQLRPILFKNYHIDTLNWVVIWAWSLSSAYDERSCCCNICLAPPHLYRFFPRAGRQPDISSLCSSAFLSKRKKSV